MKFSRINILYISLKLLLISYILYLLTFPIDVSPSIIPAYGKFTLGITRNNSINISVIITAIPPVNPSAIQWHFNSMLIEEHNKSNKYSFCCGRQSLTVLDVQHSDAGIYEITVGSSSINITLNVYGMCFIV